MRPAIRNADYAFYYTMDAMSGDWDAFWSEEFLGVQYFQETLDTVPAMQKHTSPENPLKVGGLSARIFTSMASARVQSLVHVTLQ